MQLAWQRGAVAHSHRTREGLRAARTRGQLQVPRRHPTGPFLGGRGPKLTPLQKEVVVEQYLAGRYGAADLGELFGVSRSTVYRALRRAERASDVTH